MTFDHIPEEPGRKKNPKTEKNEKFRDVHYKAEWPYKENQTEGK